MRPRTVLGVALLMGAAAAVFLRHQAGPVVALAATVLAALILDPKVLRLALRLSLVMAFVFAAAVSGAMVSLAQGAERGLEVGTLMLLRLLVLAITGAVIARAVDAEAIMRGARRLGLERLGLVLGLAVNVMPHLAVTVRDVWVAHRVRSRGDGLIARLAALPRLAEVLLAHTARVADEAAAAAALRGHAALVSAQKAIVAPARVVVVTGSQGSGKTAAVCSLLDALRSRGVIAAGFVQPGVWEEGRKTGFAIRDVATAEETVLAVRVGRDQGQYGTGFRFTRQGFELARRALEGVAGRELLVVDELGPLELRGRGHMAAVRTALSQPGVRSAVVVVRRHLVPSLLAALEARDAVVVDVEHAGDAAVETMARALGV